MDAERLLNIINKALAEENASDELKELVDAINKLTDAIERLYLTPVVTTGLSQPPYGTSVPYYPSYEPTTTCSCGDSNTTYKAYEPLPEAGTCTFTFRKHNVPYGEEE